MNKKRTAEVVSRECWIHWTPAQRQQWNQVFQPSSLMGTRTPSPAWVENSTVEHCEVPLTSRHCAHLPCTTHNNHSISRAPRQITIINIIIIIIIIGGVALVQFGGTTKVPLKATKLHRCTTSDTRCKRCIVSRRSPEPPVNLWPSFERNTRKLSYRKDDRAMRPM